MKSFKYPILPLLFSVVFLSLSSCKKEGCTDETATNYDPDAKSGGECIYPPQNPNPVVSILEPLENIELSREIELSIDLSDDVGLSTATIVVSADALSGSGYYSTTRALSGTEESLELTAELPEVDMIGDHYILVTCVDVEGNETTEGKDFTVSDTEGPEVADSSNPSSVPYESGYPSLSFSVEFQDPGGVASFEFEFWAHRFLGNDPMFDTEHTENPVLIREGSEEYTVAAYASQSFEEDLNSLPIWFGDYWIDYTITDVSGNVTTGRLTGVID